MLQWALKLLCELYCLLTNDSAALLPELRAFSKNVNLIHASSPGVNLSIFQIWMSIVTNCTSTNMFDDPGKPLSGRVTRSSTYIVSKYASSNERQHAIYGCISSVRPDI